MISAYIREEQSMLSARNGRQVEPVVASYWASFYPIYISSTFAQTIEILFTVLQIWVGSGALVC